MTRSVTVPARWRGRRGGGDGERRRKRRGGDGVWPGWRSGAELRDMFGVGGNLALMPDVGVRRASDRRRRKRSECERERVRVVFGAAEVAAFSDSIQQLK